MSTRANISAKQFWVILYLSRMFSIFSYTSISGGAQTGWTTLVAILFSFITDILFLLPTFFLLKKYPKMNVIDCSLQLLGKGGKAVALLFTIIMVAIASQTVANFEMFLTSSVYSGASHILICILFVLVAVYAVYMGIESISRFALVVFWAFILAMAFIVFAGLGKCSLNNIPPLFYEQFSTPFSVLLNMSIRNTEYFLLLLATPIVSGKYRNNILGWLVSIVLTFEVISFVMIGAMGDLASSQLFPFYTLSSIAEISIFQRLDALHIGIWIFIAFIKTAVYISFGAKCIRYLMPFKARKADIPVVGAAVLILSGLLSGSIKFLDAFLKITGNIALYAIVIFVLPLFLLLVRGCKNKKGIVKKAAMGMALVLAVLPTLSSCIPSVQMNERAIVQAMGIDYVEEKYQITLQLYSPERVGDNVADTEKNTTLLKSTGDTITQALENAQRLQGKELFHSHSKVLLIGESIAEKGLEYVVNFFSSDFKMRPNLKLFLCRGSAGDIISIQTEEGILPASVLERIANKATQSGQSADVTLRDLAMAQNAEYSGVYVPVVRKYEENGQEQIGVFESAVFHKGILAGFLNMDETKGALFLSGKLQQAVYTVDLGNDTKVSVQLSNIHIKNKSLVENTQPVLDMGLSASGSIAETINTGGDGSLDIEKLQKALEEKIKNDIYGAWMKGKEYSCDYFSMWQKIRTQHPDFWKQYQAGWDEMFIKSDLRLTTNISIDRLGLQKL